jgi:hypothetical protein
VSQPCHAFDEPFWEIRRCGTEVKFGRIGTNGKRRSRIYSLSLPRSPTTTVVEPKMEDNQWDAQAPSS